MLRVEIEQREQDLILGGGVRHAIEVAYSTPIAPQLRALPEEKQASFRQALTELVDVLSDDGLAMGRMVSNVLFAEKST